MSNFWAKKNLWFCGKQSKRFRTKVIGYWRAGSSAKCRWCCAIWVVRVVRDRHAMPTHHPNRIVVACQLHHHHPHWTVCQRLHHRRHWIVLRPLQRQPRPPPPPLLQQQPMSHIMTIIITVIMTIWARIRIRLQSTGKKEIKQILTDFGGNGFFLLLFVGSFVCVTHTQNLSTSQHLDIYDGELRKKKKQEVNGILHILLNYGSYVSKAAARSGRMN